MSELKASIVTAKERTQLVDELLQKYNLNDVSEIARNAIYECLANYIINAAAQEEKNNERKMRSTTFITEYYENAILKHETSLQTIEASADVSDIMDIFQAPDPDVGVVKTKKQQQPPTECLNKDEIPHFCAIEEAANIMKLISKNTVLKGKSFNIAYQTVNDLETDKLIAIDSYKRPFHCRGYTLSKMDNNYSSDTGYYYTDEFGIECYRIVSENFLDYFKPQIWRGLIKYYSKLKESSYEKLNGDMHWIILDFEHMVDTYIKPSPILFDVLCWRIDGILIKDITRLINDKYIGEHLKETQISALLNRTIPEILSNAYKKKYTISKFYSNPNFLLSWKRCGRCGRVLPRHEVFFNKNASFDDFYSLCCDCRSQKTIERNINNPKLFKNVYYRRPEINPKFNEEIELSSLIAAYEEDAIMKQQKAEITKIKKLQERHEAYDKTRKKKHAREEELIRNGEADPLVQFVGE